MPVFCCRSPSVVIAVLAAVVCGVAEAQPKTLAGHSDPPYAAVYTPDGQRLITAAFDKTLRMWDLTSLTSLRTMQGHTGLVLCLSLSKDAKRLASGSLDNTVRLWDLPVNTPLTTLAAQPGLASVAVSSDGQWWVTGGAGNSIKIWNAADRQLVREIGGLPHPIVRVALRADKQQIAAVDAAGFVRLFNANDGTPQGAFGVSTPEITGLVGAPNNSFWLTAGADGLVKRWLNQAAAARVGAGHEGAILALKVSPNNQVVVTGGQDKAVRVWNFGDAKQVRTLDGHGGAVAAVAFHHNDAGRVATGGEDKIARLFNVNDGMLIKAFPEQAAAIAAVAIHPNNQELAAADASGAIRVWKIEDGTEIRALAGHPGGTWSLAFTADGKSPGLRRSGQNGSSLEFGRWSRGPQV
jgi:WD40 repeat protein